VVEEVTEQLCGVPVDAETGQLMIADPVMDQIVFVVFVDTA